jgi:hypothetical protein
VSNEARDHEEVICPNCVHQFRAISDADQTHRAVLQQRVAELRGHLWKEVEFCIASGDVDRGNDLRAILLAAQEKGNDV